MSYSQSRMFSEGPSRHEEPEEKLWRPVIQLAAQEAPRNKHAAIFFSSPCWKIVSKELFCAATIQKFEAAFAQPAVELTTRIVSDEPEVERTYNKTNWSERPKAVKAREQYRAKAAEKSKARQEQRLARERARQEANDRKVQAQPTAATRSAMSTEERMERERIRCREKKRAAIGYYERREPGYVPPPRKQDDPQWHAARAAKKREKYRKQSGFYERRGIIPTQESAPCPAS